MAQSEKELREAVKMVLAAHSSFYDVVIQGIWGQLKGRSLGTRVISLPETRAASFLDEYRHYYVIDPIIPAYAIVHEAKQHLELTKLEYPASSSRRSATRFEAIEVSDVPGVDLLLLVTQPSGGGTKPYLVNLQAKTVVELGAREVAEDPPQEEAPRSNPPKRELSQKQRRQAELRRAFAGRWVGWTPDFEDIAVDGSTPEEAYSAGEKSRHLRLIYEYLPPPDPEGNPR